MQSTVKAFFGNVKQGTSVDQVRNLFKKHGKILVCRVFGIYAYILIELKTTETAAASEFGILADLNQ